MLGENHSLLSEFPEFKILIAELIENDEAFAADAKRYNKLDEDIRNLEMDGAPIGDEEMHQLKHNRAVLKDSLYARLQKENS